MFKLSAKSVFCVHATLKNKITLEKLFVLSEKNCSFFLSLLYSSARNLVARDKSCLMNL